MHIAVLPSCFSSLLSTFRLFQALFGSPEWFFCYAKHVSSILIGFLAMSSSFQICGDFFCSANHFLSVLSTSRLCQAFFGYAKHFPALPSIFQLCWAFFPALPSIFRLCWALLRSSTRFSSMLSAFSALLCIFLLCLCFFLFCCVLHGTEDAWHSRKGLSIAQKCLVEQKKTLSVEEECLVGQKKCSA